MLNVEYVQGQTVQLHYYDLLHHVCCQILIVLLIVHTNIKVVCGR